MDYFPLRSLRLCGSKRVLEHGDHELHELRVKKHFSPNRGLRRLSPIKRPLIKKHESEKRFLCVLCAFAVILVVWAPRIVGTPEPPCSMVQFVASSFQHERIARRSCNQTWLQGQCVRPIISCPALRGQAANLSRGCAGSGDSPDSTALRARKSGTAPKACCSAKCATVRQFHSPFRPASHC